jgi:hypothetical protein
MKDGRVRALLWIIAAAMVASLVVFVLDQPREEPAPLPSDSLRLASRLAAHPTDWEAASALSERALDEESPRRLELWRAASALAVQLAPHFDLSRHGYVRAGLFHWYELNESDRRNVLAAIAPLLQERGTFFRLAGPLFELTGDLTYLRRNQPHTAETIDGLRLLAVTNGRFGDYRELRGELVAARTADVIRQLDNLPPSQIVAALPAHPTTDDQPMILAALRALHDRPLEVDCGRPDILGALIDYGVRHRLPLDGLAMAKSESSWADAFTRAELARALGDAQGAAELDHHGVRPPRGEVVTVNGVSWEGSCGQEICRSITADIDGPKSITLETGKSDEVPPYIECYIDDVRVWEGPIVNKVTIVLAPAGGRHHVEITLVNRLTRNRAARAVRIS